MPEEIKPLSEDLLRAVRDASELLGVPGYDDLLTRTASLVAERDGFTQMDENQARRFAEIRRLHKQEKKRDYVGVEENGGIAGNLAVQDFMSRAGNVMRLVMASQLLHPEAQGLSSDALKERFIFAMFHALGDPKYGITKGGPFVAALDETIQGKAAVDTKRNPLTRRRLIDGEIFDRDRIRDILGMTMMLAVESLRDNPRYQGVSLYMPSRLP